MRNPRDGYQHSERFGIGVLAPFRGRGLGLRIAEEAIRAAWELGMERIDLVVFATDAPAVGLYEKLGFEQGGVRRRARKVHGHYDDELMMALLRFDRFASPPGDSASGTRGTSNPR